MTVYFSEETSSVQSVRIRGRALGGGGGGEGDSGGTFVCGLRREEGKKRRRKPTAHLGIKQQPEFFKP